MNTESEELPHWDLTNVYPGLNSPEFEQAFADAKLLVDDLEKFVGENQISSVKVQNGVTNLGHNGRLAAGMIDRLN